MNCPRCGVGGQLANVKDALLINKGPEGPLNIVVCLRCKTVLVGNKPCRFISGHFGKRSRHKSWRRRR